MRIPRLLVLTDRRRSEASGRSLCETVTRAVDAGAPAVLLREKDLPRTRRRELAATIADAVRARGAELIVASDAGLAAEVGAGGVHLAAADPPLVQAERFVGRSCHDVMEVRAAVADKVDYVTVSPVALTRSKPGYGPALGRAGLMKLVAEAADLPVLALGGVTPPSVPMWLEAGAQGVAVLDAVMGADDPAMVVHTIIDQFEQEHS